MHTNHGPIEFELFDEDAPKTVENFVKLSGDGYYDGLIFHRVIKDFMVQGGCPHGTGTGGPGYEFEDEFNDNKIVRGALAMANRGPNTNGSQFFIVTTDAAPWLDGKHTVFGRVASGMEAVDAIEGLETGAGDRPVEDARIERMEVQVRVSVVRPSSCSGGRAAPLTRMRSRTWSGSSPRRASPRRSGCVHIESDEQAASERFPGSPTIRIGGEDIVPPGEGEPFTLTCRIYRLRDGRISPTPDPEDVRAAVRRAKEDT